MPDIQTHTRQQEGLRRAGGYLEPRLADIVRAELDVMDAEARVRQDKNRARVQAPPRPSDSKLRFARLGRIHRAQHKWRHLEQAEIARRVEERRRAGPPAVELMAGRVHGTTALRALEAREEKAARAEQDPTPGPN